MSRRQLPGGKPLEPSRPDADPLDALIADTQPGGEVEASQEPEPHWRPRIYVASLSDYNAGVLHGAWVAAGYGVEAMQAEIDAMLEDSPTTWHHDEVAEEWAIHDYDGWGRHLRIDEMEGLETIDRLARGLRAHGEAFGAWVDLTGSRDPDDLDAFEEHYIGEYRDLDSFGEDQLDDLGFDVGALPGAPEGLRPYVQVDVAGWTRDMQVEGAISTMEGGSGVYVFWSF